jgi:hypothetical protein
MTRLTSLPLTALTFESLDIQGPEDSYILTTRRPGKSESGCKHGERKREREREKMLISEQSRVFVHNRIGRLGEGNIRKNILQNYNIVNTYSRLDRLVYKHATIGWHGIAQSLSPCFAVRQVNISLQFG